MYVQSDKTYQRITTATTLIDSEQPPKLPTFPLQSHYIE